MNRTLGRLDASRLVSRHFTRRSAPLTAAWRRAFDLDLVQLLILQVVLSANLAHLRNGPAGLFTPDEDSRPVSIMAVAQSMGLPHETVRRQANRLAELSLLVRKGRGWIVPVHTFSDPAGKALVTHAAADVRRFAAELREAGYAPATLLSDERLAALPDDLLARQFNDVMVRALEPLVDTYGDLIVAAVSIALVAANVEHIAADVRLSARYAAHDTVPPDEERIPITIRELARRLDLPYATVRRHVAALAERGLAVTKANGVIVPARALSDPVFARNNAKLTLHVDAMLGDLARL